MTNSEKLDLSLTRFKSDLAGPFWEHGIVWPPKQPTEKVLLQLMNWKVWAMRYGVPLGWVVRTVLEHFDFNRQRRRAINSLGVPPITATASAVEAYIRERVLAEYPNGENLAMARVNTVARILGGGGRMGDAPPEMRTRRAWRGNPWR
jgi:hypothetical protein